MLYIFRYSGCIWVFIFRALNIMVYEWLVGKQLPARNHAILKLSMALQENFNIGMLDIHVSALTLPCV